MGLFGLFGNKKPSEKAIRGQVTRAKEQYAKSDYRQMAMDKLLNWGDKESLKGLLERFSVVVQSPHWDEEEKRWLVEQLSNKGDVAKEVLTEFLLTGNAVSHAIQALNNLCSKEELAQILSQALKARLPEDYRSSQSKQELIYAMQEHSVQNLSEEVMPYLDDHNDDVKCSAIEVISAQKSENAYPQIAAMLTQDYHSARVLRKAALTVCDLQIPIDPKQTLATEVMEDFIVQNGSLKPAHQS